MTTITIDRALLEQALEALNVATTPLARDRQEVLRAQAALRSALEQPQQEPVAWMMVNPTHLPSSRSLHWEPQNWHITWQSVPLYTHPAPRTEQPRLTEEEIDEIWNGLIATPDFSRVMIARAIEARILGEQT